MSDNILLNFGNPIKWNRVLSWSYCSWIYNYLCNQCISPLKLWVWMPLRRGSIQRYVIKLVSYLRQVWFSSGTPVSSTNKTDHHDITEILLKVALNTITLSPTLKWNRLKYMTTIYMKQLLTCVPFNFLHINSCNENCYHINNPNYIISVCTDESLHITH